MAHEYKFPPSYHVLTTKPVLQVDGETRQKVLQAVQNNVFAFPAALVAVDYLSDSGTTAMTANQWSGLMLGDESYGRNTGYYCLLEAIRDIFERGDHRENAVFQVLTGSPNAELFHRFIKSEEGGFANGGVAQILRPNTFIVPQGRCAESLIFQATADRLKTGASMSPVIASNGFFDTTRANAITAGFDLVTFLKKGLMCSASHLDFRTRNTFKGNMDIDSLSRYLSERRNSHRVALVILTITNNWAGGQPVSMANIRAVSKLSAIHGIPLFFDACRFAENAKFIQDFEDGYRNRTVENIIQEMFSYADGFTISFKKDALGNIGGALCLRDNGTYALKYPGIGVAIKEQQILRYGNDSYGGMSGRDIMTVVVGLYEATKESHLSTRIEQVRRFAENFLAAEIPVLLPPGGSHLFLDMDRFFDGCGRSHGDFAALGFTLQLLGSYGIRAFESGPFAWEWDKVSEAERGTIPNFVRFAIPRNAMTDDHFNYTVAAVKELFDNRHSIPSVQITHGKELSLRHFQSILELRPVDPNASG